MAREMEATPSERRKRHGGGTSCCSIRLPASSLTDPLLVPWDSREGDVRWKRKRKWGEVKGRREESRPDSASGQTKMDRKEMGAEWTEQNRQGKKKGRDEKKSFVRVKLDRSMSHS